MVFLVPGFYLVFAAKKLVKKYHFDERVKGPVPEGMNEEDIKQYKFQRALVNLKLLGMLILLPGVVLVYFAFR